MLLRQDSDLGYLIVQGLNCFPGPVSFLDHILRFIPDIIRTPGDHIGALRPCLGGNTYLIYSGEDPGDEDETGDTCDLSIFDRIKSALTR